MRPNGNICKTSLQKMIYCLEIILCDQVQSQDFYVSLSKGVTFHKYMLLVNFQFSPYWDPLHFIWGRNPISLSSFQLSLLKASKYHQQSQLWLSEQYFLLQQLSTPFNVTKQEEKNSRKIYTSTQKQLYQVPHRLQEKYQLR